MSSSSSLTDIAERGVAIAKEYTDKLTSNSDHKQAVYQVVHWDRLETNVLKGSLTKISVRVT